MSLRSLLLTTACISFAAPAFAQEVNIYTTRQPELIQPVMRHLPRKPVLR